MLDKMKNLSQVVASRVANEASRAVNKATKTKALGKSKKGAQEEYLVALDIGTEFVKALVGRVKPDGVEIIGVGRAHQALSDMQAGAIADISSVVENCDKALSQAEDQAGVSARTAVIGIAGELVKGTTTTVRVSRKQADKALDLAEMERIIKLVQQRAEAKAKQQLAWELGGKEVEVRLVNSALVGIEIDGYKVTNPIGFQGRDIVVQLYTAFAPMIHIGALERTAQQLDLDLLAVAAEPFAVARSVIGDNANASMSAILMDVGGGTTDIAVINDGGVQGTKMFGIGGRAYTRSVERELSVEFDVAEELKLGLSDNHIPPQKIPAVEGALNKTLDVWMSGVELALGEFDKLDHLPFRLLLCGGGSSLDMLMDKLQDTDWYTKLAFTRKPTVQHIQPSQVIGIVDKTGYVTDHTFITAMGLLRVGLDTTQFAGNDPASSMREKLDRMLRV
ncbi:MAG TPA: cell division FtsA domain-containing protein [Candidatus Saccharimonadales bacterium]|nr:cell division FtsA domain-containing protein [Candidatus Saccharimonadales bacterium]